MVFLLLAPYNDSMQLGQGFNSFLQVPCIDGAVEIPPNAMRTQAARAHGARNVSQVVSYSSRFVDKISDVVRSMNISAASSIKSGTIEVSGNSLSVDEAKFQASDMNAVVSVKVINQTTQMIKDARFLPIPGMKMDSEEFFDIYGDCYISGFMEGGDLHGIVSIKVLNASKKTEVERALKGQMNGSTNDFTLSEGSSLSNMSAALNETENTITVNWSGGGQIKPDEEEWSLESLFRAASSFPSRVAACPQRTWAILTKYDNNRSFVKWAKENNIVVPNFSTVQQNTSDLLDMYMEYKNNLSRVQAVMANPSAFKLSPYRQPVNLSVEALVAERKAIKAEMRKIVDIIDSLNSNPSKQPAVEILSPEVWATRLPVPKDSLQVTGGFEPNKAVEILSGFSFVNEPAQPQPAAEDSLKAAMTQVEQDVEKKAVEMKSQAPEVPFAEPPPGPICTPGITAMLNKEEQDFVNSDENRRLYAKYRFDSATGHDGGGPFNDAIQLQQAMVPVAWPRRLEFRMISWGGQSILRWVQVDYDQMQLVHGSEGTAVDSMTIELAADEKVNRMRMAKGTEIWGVEGVRFVEVFTSSGQNRRLGDEGGQEVKDYYPYDGCQGLKSFFGGAGDVIDKLAPIWGM